MSVIPLTLTISLGLVTVFVLFFLREQARGRFSSPEREALLPLSTEKPQVASSPLPSAISTSGKPPFRS
jgi:hypothetical protein